MRCLSCLRGIQPAHGIRGFRLFCSFGLVFCKPFEVVAGFEGDDHFGIGGLDVEQFGGGHYAIRHGESQTFQFSDLVIDFSDIVWSALRPFDSCFFIPSFDLVSECDVCGGGEVNDALPVSVLFSGLNEAGILAIVEGFVELLEVVVGKEGWRFCDRR